MLSREEEIAILEGHSAELERCSAVIRSMRDYENSKGWYSALLAMPITVFTEVMGSDVLSTQLLSQPEYCLGHWYFASTFMVDLSNDREAGVEELQVAVDRQLVNVRHAIQVRI